VGAGFPRPWPLIETLHELVQFVEGFVDLFPPLFSHGNASLPCAAVLGDSYVRLFSDTKVLGVLADPILLIS
jgi:hypothetical protein